VAVFSFWLARQQRKEISPRLNRNCLRVPVLLIGQVVVPFYRWSTNTLTAKLISADPLDEHVPDQDRQGGIRVAVLVKRIKRDFRKLSMPRHRRGDGR
jgi:hypothetical protein